MNDSGICIIADTRLYNKQYGKIILDSFPVESNFYNSVDSLILQSQKFF